MKLLDALPMHYAVSVTHWNSFRIGAFREQFTIAHQDGTSFWLGAALNGKATEWGRVRLDFNPNKVAQHSAFQTLLLFLVRNTRPMHRIVKRFDLAVDIPADRFDCFLVKDNRAYSERRHGREWTQYLGAKSSTVGRVKLYNKTVEARLNYPLTRLELTLDPAVGYDEMAFPTVYAAFTAQISTDEFEATDTERFILGALLNGYGSLNMLGRKTRAKMEHLLELYVQRVEISKSEYAASGIYYCIDHIFGSVPEVVPQEIWLEMMLFDYLIGNTDRHQSNWGLLLKVSTDKKRIRLRHCPLYDNGSSLCCYVNESQLAAYAGRDTKRFDALVDSKSKSMIRIDGSTKKRPSHSDVVRFLLTEFSDTEVIARNFISLLDAATIDALLDQYPATILSRGKNQLIRRYLHRKIELLAQILTGKDNDNVGV